MYCCICFGSGGTGQWAALYCGHVFHHACIEQCFKHPGQRCPTCRETKTGPKGRKDLFFKLYVDDAPQGGSETQIAEEAQEDDPIRLRRKVDLLNAKIDDMGRSMELAREKSQLDQAEINQLQHEVDLLSAALQDKSIRHQKALDDYNAIAAQNKRLQNEFASAKLNLEREKSSNSRARLAFDTQISSRELTAQLTTLAQAGACPPDYFQKLLESRNKAVAEANTRAQKSEVARATGEARATEETKKLKLQIQNLKAQIQEYQEQLEKLKQQQLQQQEQQQREMNIGANNNNNRKRPAPPSWLLDAETQEAGGVRPVVTRPKQQQQQEYDLNFLNASTTALPNKFLSRSNVRKNNSGSGGVATHFKNLKNLKPNPRSAVLGTEIDGLLGPASELPSMHPPAPRGPQLAAAAPALVVEAAAAPQPQLPAGDDGDNTIDINAAGPGLAGKGPRRSLLEHRKYLNAKKQVQPQTAAAAAPEPEPAHTGAAVWEDRKFILGPIEWGTEVENAAADVNEEDNVIELISDTEEEEEKEEGLQIEDEVAVAQAKNDAENDPRALNINQQQQQQRAPSKATISLLAAGPSKIALASAPGTSFIRHPKFATTGLKDDATYIHSGPDGKGGRVTYYRGQQQQQKNQGHPQGGNRPAAVARPAWGATMKDHLSARDGAGAGGCVANPGKRVKGGGAGSSRPISQYFSGTVSRPSE